MWDRDPQPVIEIFNQLFQTSHRTELCEGGSEPFYLPASSSDQMHRIYFREGYFSSALHEVAHWCVAGKQRRMLEDYGYWYQPDGRTSHQQKQFEAVERKPQALESLFAKACDHPFVLSADNLESALACSPNFEQAVERQVNHYLKHGLPRRARLFLQACHARFESHSLMCV